MQEDFHYYATYSAAYLAGFSHEEALDICYAAQLVDWCTRSFLAGIKGPLSAATTQQQSELAAARTDLLGLQDITRIWASFHFLPYDLYDDTPKGTRQYRNKYRLICNPNGDLLVDTVRLARRSSLPSIGLAMHVLANTWAHRYFAGTPSLVINNTNRFFVELVPDGDGFVERPVRFTHNATAPDDPETGHYLNSLFQPSEHAVMNLGHGRAGHLPDYSFARYRYLPAWGDYEEVLKDNPSEYLHAFCQMVYAMRFIRGDEPSFEKCQYAWDVVAPWRDEIETILNRRQLDASEDWKAFGERLSGETIAGFDLTRHQAAYLKAPPEDKDATFLGQFILAALAQKSMVTRRIFESGNLLAGISIDFDGRGLRGIRDFMKLVQAASGGDQS